MERAEALEGAAAGGAEGDVVGDDVVDLGLLTHLRDVFLANPAGHAGSLRRRADRPRADTTGAPWVRPAHEYVDARTDPGHSVHDDPTVGALVHDLSQQVPELIRSELRLAQAEMTEKGKRAGLGIGMFSGAGLLAFFGLALRHRDRDPRRWPTPCPTGSRR